jgi:hypothetical protein
VSEYQYYEFLAIDRPLDDTEQAEVRSLSTRATITATSFVNEYHWGDFKGDPNRLMERYYDAHLYLANWGTHRVMFRLPRDLLDPDIVEDYRVDNQVDAWVADEFVVLDLTSQDEAGEFDLDHDPEALLSAIVGVRVPPGLATLTAAQRSLADFLRLDDDLLTTAAQTSRPIQQAADDAGELATWVTRLPVTEKNRLMARVVLGEATRVRMELLRRFHDDNAPITTVAPRRTVADLLDDAARRRADRQRRQVARQAEDEVRREQARVLARERRLDQLARDEDTAWSRVEAMIATRKPTEYDAAVTLLADLQALAERDDHYDTFAARTLELRRTHARRPSLIQRLDRAGI